MQFMMLIGKAQQKQADTFYNNWGFKKAFWQ